MGIVVPILRTAFVLLNIYETFKTLKFPPPSARNGYHPIRFLPTCPPVHDYISHRTPRTVR